MGLIYLRSGLISEAMSEFQKATTFNMGCINEVLGNIDVAVDLYRKCGDFKPALERLKVLNVN